MMIRATALAAAALLVACPTLAFVDQYARDPRTPRDFMRLHPCPANGAKSGPCPGYIRDHIVPLCKGGRDTVDNMQWQTIAEAKWKDRWECK